jgi:hypothetical protein
VPDTAAKAALLVFRPGASSFETIVVRAFTALPV